MAVVVEQDEQVSENTADSPGNSGTQDFFSSLQAFTPAEWDRDLMLYLYRLEPRRPGTDKNPNIRKYTSPPSLDEIKAKYGSGKYQFILNRRDPKAKKGTKTVDTYVFEIEDPDFPPVVPGLDGWERDPQNARWAGWTKPVAVGTVPANGTSSAEGTLIQMLREELARARSTQPKDSIEAVAISKAMDVLTTAYKTGIENTSKGGDGNGLAIVKEVLSVLGTAKGKGDGIDPIITLLMTQQENQINLMMKQQEQQAKELAAARERSDTLMLKLLEKKEEKSDVLGSFKGIVSAFKEFQDLTGGAGPEGTAPAVRGWPGIVLSALNNPQVGSLITGLGQAIPFWAARSAGARPAGGTPPPAPGTRTGPDMSIPPVPGAIGPDAVQSQPQPTQPNPEGQNPMLQTMYEIAGRAADAFTRRVRGGDFAQSVKDVYGLGVFEQIQKAGTAQIMGLLKTAPFWGQLAPHEAEFTAFVQEFVDDVEYEEVTDESLPPEPAESKRKGAKK